MALTDDHINFYVMPGLDPGIHFFTKKMDCRVEPGNDK
jgi:hypothetical protein